MAGTTQAAPGAATPEFSIARVFTAPRERIFQAWTEPERLAQWWGPKGFAIRIARLELRPGGTFLYSMDLPDGRKMWGKFTYREILPPERLVYLSAFTDDMGAIIRSPYAADWPLQVLNTLTLTEANGHTTLTLCADPYEATEAERRAFATTGPSLQQGFKGTFDQLDAYLAGS